MTPRPSPLARIGGWPALLVATCVALSASLAVLWLLSPDDGNGTVSVDDFVDEGSAGENPDPGEPVAVGDPLPDVVLEGLGGDDIDTSSLRGDVVVLNFWSSGCAPCVREMPLLEDAHTGLGGEVRIIGVDVAEGEEPGRKMMEQTGVTYPQTRDPSSSVLRLFGGINLPYTVVIAGDGTVAATHTGEIEDEGELMELLDEAR